jgi:colanic acid biosynthesis glycosyl transferase WcaI
LRFKPDVIIAPSPPLTIGLSAWAIAIVRRAKYIYNVQEIYPDIAVNLGMMKNPRIINFFKWMERFIYRKSMAVTSITPAMCDKIKERVAPNKVHHIPNFVDLSDVKTVARDNEFAKTYDLQNRFVVTYAGNMGVPQNLGVLIDLAKALPNLTVLFVGDGGDAARLKQLAENVENVRFVPYQPLSRMPEIYACSDLFYVGQDPKACSDGIPSKIYRILGYKKPLLVLTAPNSDLAQFVTTAKSGILLSENHTQAVEQLRTLMEQPETLKTMGVEGYDYVANVFARPIISQQYETLCKQALEA